MTLIQTRPLLLHCLPEFSGAHETDFPVPCGAMRAVGIACACGVIGCAAAGTVRPTPAGSAAAKRSARFTFSPVLIGGHHREEGACHFVSELPFPAYVTGHGGGGLAEQLVFPYSIYI